MEPSDLRLNAGIQGSWPSTLLVSSKEMWLWVKDGMRDKNHFTLEKGEPKQMIKASMSG